MRKRLILIGVAAASLAACGPVASDGYSPPNSLPSISTPSVPAIPETGIEDADGTFTYVGQFRRQFPELAEGKTDEQIMSDGEASCSDMAASRSITTPSMATRYGLTDSTADQFTLHNIALLAMTTLCPVS